VIVPDIFEEPGDIDVQTVGEEAASEEVSVPSRFTTKLFVTIAALAGAASTNTKVDAVSATNATNAGSFPHIWRNFLYTAANILDYKFTEPI
jgi:hypothetical protein